ncbi:hypothetical protein BTHE68_53490 [Burkholderia sp. THE68]|uniref:hypothetical protein n=1 Tax=Burkholderia sp. THE68 TaxID=758782 RepID=UPI001315D1FB|nr:hypothetical protein [Burkholderia sp. THE68]BBU31615.1 hypothetical protein BTHE68_53490 [Burkholderia sp. THE68]
MRFHVDTAAASDVSSTRLHLAHSAPWALTARGAAMRVLFATLQQTVDVIREREDQMRHPSGASADQIGNALGELRTIVDARMAAYHEITSGHRARETAAVEAELAQRGYVQCAEKLYDAADDLIGKIDAALAESGRNAQRFYLKAIQTAMSEMTRRAIHLLMRVRNFGPESA